ncbi:Perlucin-like protein [Stylophora pistillata]|uniref:Perlucin-like protein n=1 Tax=Stylophora pistillata TaxID=50429 RepID=A0A2B4SJS4_STYPI|nr:Perlucin-like protein [Stylophora pistillata]
MRSFFLLFVLQTWNVTDGSDAAAQDCGSVVNDTLKSPNYPEGYPHNMDCEFIVPIPSDFRIKVTFEYIKLPNLKDWYECMCDYLTVRADNRSYGKYCGAMTGETILVTGNYIVINFHAGSGFSNKERGFVLQFEVVDPPVQPSICPTGWYYQYGSSCYKFSSESLTWNEAVTHCQSLGGYLVKIDDANEQSFITEKIKEMRHVQVRDEERNDNSEKSTKSSREREEGARFKRSVEAITETKRILDSQGVCALHFVTGRAAASWDRYHIDWVPHLNLGKEQAKQPTVKEERIYDDVSSLDPDEACGSTNYGYFDGNETEKGNRTVVHIMVDRSSSTEDFEIVSEGRRNRGIQALEFKCLFKNSVYHAPDEDLFHSYKVRLYTGLSPFEVLNGSIRTWYWNLDYPIKILWDPKTLINRDPNPGQNPVWDPGRILQGPGKYFHKGSATWIGLHDPDNSNNFKWIYDDTLANFSNWNTNEPNNPAEDCATAYGVWYDMYDAPFPAGKWNDIQCSVTTYFICEKNADCGSVVNNTLKSPNYPKGYPHNMKCSYSVPIPPGKRMKIKFQYFKLPDPITDMFQCLEDFLMVHNEQEQYFGSYCGTAFRETIFATGNKVVLKFQSLGGFDSNDRGFLLHFEAADPPVQPSNCPSGWYYQYGSSCYRFSSEIVSWHEAVRRCKSHGGHLLKIDDADEQSFITNTINASRQMQALWIGLHDLDNEDEFTWEHDNTPANFSNWKNGEPDKSGSEEDCVAVSGILFHMYSQPYPPGRWYDIKCDKSAPYICEKNRKLSLWHLDLKLTFCINNVLHPTHGE